VVTLTAAGRSGLHNEPLEFAQPFGLVGPRLGCYGLNRMRQSLTTTFGTTARALAMISRGSDILARVAADPRLNHRMGLSDTRAALFRITHARQSDQGGHFGQNVEGCR
jgi:hypothetical protein